MTREELDARIARICEYGYDQEMLKLIAIIDELWDEAHPDRRCPECGGSWHGAFSTPSPPGAIVRVEGNGHTTHTYSGANINSTDPRDSNEAQQ